MMRKVVMRVAYHEDWIEGHKRISYPCYMNFNDECGVTFKDEASTHSMTEMVKFANLWVKMGFPRHKIFIEPAPTKKIKYPNHYEKRGS